MPGKPLSNPSLSTFFMLLIKLGVLITFHNEEEKGKDSKLKKVCSKNRNASPEWMGNSVCVSIRRGQEGSDWDK